MITEGNTDTHEGLATWLVNEIAERLEVAPKHVDVDAEFDELGLDSVQAVALSGALSDKVGIELPATLLYEHRSIRELSAYLTGHVESGQQENAQ